MAEQLKPSLCVIGGGAGGLSVASAAAALGVPVVLVEQGKMGGEYLNRGDVPSKTLLAATRRFGELKGYEAFGIDIGKPTLDFVRVRAHMAAAMAAVAPDKSAERFTGLGVRVIAGSARFTDPDTVRVGDDIEIKADNIVIATGSSPTSPLINGLDSVKYYTSETIFDLTECPRHLVILGAGTVGIELAQAFRRFGAAVTVIEMRRPLVNNDAEGVDLLLAQLQSEGIVIHAGSVVTNLAPKGGDVEITFDGDTGRQAIEGTHLLLAVGRWPNVDGLDLNAAGVKHNANGITVDAQLRTSNKKVFAVGDVTGGARFTHAANYHAGIVVRNALLKGNSTVDPRAIPHVIFTDPEFAQVGLTEAEAVREGHKLSIMRSSYFDNDRAQIEGETRGYIKVIADKDGNILGVTIVGRNAGELITTWTLAVTQRLNLRDMAQLVVPYPTLGEIGKNAAISFLGAGLTRPGPGRIIDRFFRRG